MQALFSSEPPEIRVFTRRSVRSLDKAAIDECGIPGILLMENAAASIEHSVRTEINRFSLAQLIIFIGPGNNGGDGLALARRLSFRGTQVVGACAFDVNGDGPQTSDARTNWEIARRSSVALIDLNDPPSVESVAERLGSPSVLIVDALLGSGASRTPSGVMAKCVDMMNAARAPGSRVLAVDIPTGLDCDSGVPFDAACCVRADVTISLAGMKQGFLNSASRAWTGDVIVGDIGVPLALLRRFGDAMPNA